MFFIYLHIHSVGPIKVLYTSTPSGPVHFGYSLTFPPLSIVRYSFMQLSELGHRGENENAQTLKC